MSLSVQDKVLECWSAGATLRAEQGPCEPSKGFLSKSGERLREPERGRESQSGSKRVRESQSQRETEKARESQRESERVRESQREP